MHVHDLVGLALRLAWRLRRNHLRVGNVQAHALTKSAGESRECAGTNPKKGWNCVRREDLGPVHWFIILKAAWAACCCDICILASMARSAACSSEEATASNNSKGSSGALAA